MNKRMVKRGTRRAFTLLEVLMVVAIIGLLAAFVVPNLFGSRDRAQIDLESATVKRGLNNAVEMYRVHMGHYPESLQDLVERPSEDETLKRWAGPYLQPEQLNDSWGTEYQYEFPGKYNESGYDLASAGPDKEHGSDDDITNWKKE